MSDILAAGYNTGDKRRDVTDILKKKIKNGNLTAPVNEGEFTSILSSSETYSLSDEEKAEINKQAEEECKGANDMTCIQATKSRLMDSKLQEKQKLAKLPENYLYIIQRGTRPGEQPIVSVIPEKGTLKMRNGKVQTKDVEQVSSGPSILSTLGKLLTGFIATFGTLIGVATFALSIFLVWNTSDKYAYLTYIKYILVALSVFLPYSGYFIVLGMWLLHGYKAEKVMTME
jgi:hypothetical protein